MEVTEDLIKLCLQIVGLAIGKLFALITLFYWDVYAFSSKKDAKQGLIVLK